MSATECVVCAWRENCNLKFNYQKSELHCREFTKDVSLGAKIDGKGVDDEKNKDKDQQSE